MPVRRSSVLKAREGNAGRTVAEHVARDEDAQRSQALHIPVNYRPQRRFHPRQDSSSSTVLRSQWAGKSSDSVRVGGECAPISWHGGIPPAQRARRHGARQDGVKCRPLLACEIMISVMKLLPFAEKFATAALTRN